MYIIVILYQVSGKSLNLLCGLVRNPRNTESKETVGVWDSEGSRNDDFKSKEWLDFDNSHVGSIMGEETVRGTRTKISRTDTMFGRISTFKSEEYGMKGDRWRLESRRARNKDFKSKEWLDFGDSRARNMM
ncbi:hypothetical protein L3Y34_002725 [Caenorhabditis briggsae]|uniref:Uncharacterized protein n=1 Tax=Caenorhabditis briggsae TaxID=6238 RepID=A0AAE9ISH2_CAEBR|nr:hypothetical protein L3Y34_002725 [Caenorhabditis briggsae]